MILMQAIKRLKDITVQNSEQDDQYAIETSTKELENIYRTN